ncbi:MAG: Gx transporter family protein [Clostridiales bacterium]|nr:Gx transporter family protein [Clostridiales bacterium]
MKFLSVKKIALSGLMCAFALISFTIESLFPPLFIPGARLGISNLFILLTAILIGKGYAVAVLIIKVVLGSIFTGNISAALYALPAGLIALAIEIVLLINPKNFGLVCVSVCGAITSLTVQNIVFCLVTGVIEYLAYLPYLTLIGIFSGAVVGITAYLIYKYLPANLMRGFNISEEKK